MAQTSNVLLVSAASAWETATKVRLGRLPGATELAADFQAFMLREGFTTLDITVEHGIRAGLLPGPHKDPFDRMLVAQAHAENVPLVTNERTFEAYGVGFGEESQAANRGQHSHGLVPARFIASSKATGTHQRASAEF